MRLAFLILVFGNLAFFVWSQGYLGRQEDGREPQRLAAQLNAEKVRIGDEILAEPVVPACRKIAGLSAEAAAALEAVVAGMPGWKLLVNVLPQAPEHWVLLPGFTTAASAETRRGDMQRAGYPDARVVADEANGPYVVSLGVFREAHGAQALLDALSKKRVRGVQLLERTAPAKASIEIRAPAGEIAPRLNELLTPYVEARSQECDPK